MIGGLICAYISGKSLEAGLPELMFWITGLLGILILILAFLLNPKLEEQNAEVIKMPCCARVCKILREVFCSGFKVRPLVRVLVFIILMTVMTPAFTEYFYVYCFVHLKLTPTDFA